MHRRRQNLPLVRWATTSTDRPRWARVPPHLHWKHSGLPTEWTSVIEEMPADMINPLPAGDVLLDTRRDRPLRAWAAHLEFPGRSDERGGVSLIP
jgi:hypothetical protein